MTAGPAPPGGDEARLTEARLVQAAQRGEGPALEQLLSAHYDRVHALCRRMVGEADADDATQDALLAAVRGIARFDGRSALSTWLYRVATNTCLDELRRRRRRPVVGYEEDIGDDERGIGFDDGMRGGARSGRDHAESVADRLDVDSALATLPEEFRVAVVLRDLCDFSYDEIAQATGVPAGTVRSRIARGRGALADVIGKAETLGGNAEGSVVVQSSRAIEETTSNATTATQPMPQNTTGKGEELRS